MSDWSSAKKILCIRLDAMGDLLMTTPAISALKNAVSGRTITLLTSRQGEQIAASIPLFDKVISYSAPWLKASEKREDPAMDLEMIQRLKDENFDGVVIFTVYSQNPLPSALMSFLAGIPLRAAYCRENPYALLTDWMKEDEPEKILRHEVRRHLDLVFKLGAPATNLPLILEIDAQSEISLSTKLSLRKIGQINRDWVVIHPGSTAASRRFSTQGFATVADMLIKNLGKRILFTGGADEKELIENIQLEMEGHSENLAGELSLKEMIALVGRAPLLISNNSGPVHMAAALGTPVVVLYALTNPQHTPWMVPNHVLYHDVPCRYCYKSICPEGTNACLNNIQPEVIYDKALELLSREAAPCYDYQAVNPLPL